MILLFVFNDVRAHLSLEAVAMNFVSLSAGVDVGIKQVQLGITGVRAEAYLYIDLDNVSRIVGRVIQTLDKNPAILTQVMAPAPAAPAPAAPAPSAPGAQQPGARQR